MGLKFKLKTLEGLDEATAKLYRRVGEEFHLDVDGLDKADELKEALRKEKEDHKKAKDEKKAIEDSKKEAEQRRLEEKKEFEKLWKQEREDNAKTSATLATLQAEVDSNKKSALAAKAVAKLSADPSKLEILTEKAMKFVKLDEKGEAYLEGPAGILKDTDLADHLTKSYAFLVDGSKASGGSDTTQNNDGGETTTTEQMKLSPVERLNNARGITTT